MPHSNRRLAMLAGLLGIGEAARRSPRTLPGEVQERAATSRISSPSRERARLRTRGITQPGRGIGASSAAEKADPGPLLREILTFGGGLRRFLGEEFGDVPAGAPEGAGRLVEFLQDPLGQLASRLPQKAQRFTTGTRMVQDPEREFRLSPEVMAFLERQRNR